MTVQRKVVHVSKWNEKLTLIFTKPPQNQEPLLYGITAVIPLGYVSLPTLETKTIPNHLSKIFQTQSG